MIFERDRIKEGAKRYSLKNSSEFREEDHPPSPLHLQGKPLTPKGKGATIKS